MLGLSLLCRQFDDLWQLSMCLTVDHFCADSLLNAHVFVICFSVSHISVHLIIVMIQSPLKEYNGVVVM